MFKCFKLQAVYVQILDSKRTKFLVQITGDCVPSNIADSEVMSCDCTLLDRALSVHCLDAMDKRLRQTFFSGLVANF